MDKLIEAIHNKNKAYEDYFKKWLEVEKAKTSATPPTLEQIEEVQRYYEFYQEMIRIQQHISQEKYNVTSSNYGNG